MCSYGNFGQEKSPEGIKSLFGDRRGMGHYMDWSIISFGFIEVIVSLAGQLCVAPASVSSVSIMVFMLSRFWANLGRHPVRRSNGRLIVCTFVFLKVCIALWVLGWKCEVLHFYCSGRVVIPLVFRFRQDRTQRCFFTYSISLLRQEHSDFVVTRGFEFGAMLSSSNGVGGRFFNADFETRVALFAKWVEE